MWSFVFTDEYERRLKRLKKTHEREIEAVHSNLTRYLVALEQGTPPKQIQGGWIHPELMDIFALDQRGGGKKEGGKNKGRGLAQMRLYLFPSVASLQLTLGLKDTQKDDIEFSKAYVSKHLANPPTGQPSADDCGKPRQSDERC